MKTLSYPLTAAVRTFVAVLIAFWSVCYVADAQPMPLPPENPLAASPGEALAASIQTEAAYRDLPAMSKAQWRDLDARHKRALESPDRAVQDQAMRNIIYLRNNYPHGSGFGKSFGPLSRIYRSNAPDGYRILAAVALRALDRSLPIEMMRRNLRYERSERVARITARLIVDYDASHYR